MIAADKGRPVPPHASGPGGPGIAPPLVGMASASREYFGQCLAIYRDAGFAEHEAAWRACEHCLAAKSAEHDRRVTELLEANNREVESRRAARREAESMRDQLAGARALLRLASNPPIVDQDGKTVGTTDRAATGELYRVNAYVDESGTAWTPPTAWAYRQVCLSNATNRERAEKAEAALSAYADERRDSIRRGARRSPDRFKP